MDKHISNEEFFSRLHDLFEANRNDGSGSIFLSQKRLSYETLPSSSVSSPQDSIDPLADLHLSAPVPIIVRATNGKWKAAKKDKVKISTVVQPDALESFFTRYAEVAKGGMQALKKRDRSKRKKTKKKKGSGGPEPEKKP